VRRAGARARLLGGIVAGVLLAACAGPEPAVPPGEPVPGGDFARIYLATGGDTFVPDPARGLTWLGIISHEVPFDQAESYCRRLPPHAARPWRLPGVEELAAAPFARYRLPDPPVRLWSATVPPGDASLRWVVDPYTRVREVQPVRAATRLRVLCVTEAPPGTAP